MIYNRSNVLRGTTVCDLDTRERVSHVLAINTDLGEVEVVAQPLRAAADGNILTKRIRFQAVWPILDQGFPCAFHCHGRLD